MNITLNFPLFERAACLAGAAINAKGIHWIDGGNVEAGIGMTSQMMTLFSMREAFLSEIHFKEFVVINPWGKKNLHFSTLGGAVYTSALGLWNSCSGIQNRNVRQLGKGVFQSITGGVSYKVISGLSSRVLGTVSAMTASSYWLYSGAQDITNRKFSSGAVKMSCSAAYAAFAYYRFNYDA